MNTIKTGNKRELFWDDYLINTSLTGAKLVQHQPRIEEIVMVLDAPWEGDGCDFFSIVKVGDVYRKYYLGWKMFNEDMTAHDLSGIRVCVIESKDGIHWERPKLHLRSYEGIEETNIILDTTDGTFDNFFVFIDENPDCLPEEKFKATSLCDKSGYLWCWTSADGYNFKKAWPITNKGKFDTLNVALWSKELRKYFCFVRDFHSVPGIRDIRVTTSDDFKNWTDPVMLDFKGKEDIPLYTNAIFRYPRATQMMVGMPSRYVERHEWNGNFEQLSDSEERQKRIKVSPRYGLATTDCVLMTSRDGKSWNRFDEAWMTPGIERAYNWVYGDCYPTVGTIETKSPFEGAPDELSFYTFERHWSRKPAYIRRYTVRVDGLLSYRADYAPQKLVTKPIFYEGGELSINFSTSARGYIFVTLKCEDKTVNSCELFGDTLDRTVPFEKDLTEFIGKEIVLEFTMSDADIYSMQFKNNFGDAL